MANVPMEGMVFVLQLVLVVIMEVEPVMVTVQEMVII
jgi:hypothetical protein